MPYKIFTKLLLSLLPFASLLAQTDYNYSLTHRFILTDFGVSNSETLVPLGKTSIWSLPRGMELTFSKRLSKTMRLNLPIRTGFTKGTQDTTSRTFLASDVQIQLEYPHKWVIPYVSTGLGIQQLGQKWDWGLPVFGGLNVRLDKGFFLNIQSGYRQAFKTQKSSWQHGIGLVFRFGDVKVSTKQPDLPVINQDSVVQIDSMLVQTTPSTHTKGQNSVENTALPDENSPNQSNLQDKNDKIALSDKQNALDTRTTVQQNQIVTSTDKNDQSGKNSNNQLPPLSHAEHDGAKRAHILAPDSDKTKPSIASDSTIKLTTDWSSINRYDALFKINQATLTPQTVDFLEDLAQKLLLDTKVDLILEGHTDNSGSAVYNQKLSEIRAKTCVAYLVQKGVPASRLQWVGFGESRPKFDNSTALGRQKNRRVEFRIKQ